ncbi:MAG: hypothetical protein BWY99_02435 [Synergistetes bacterium ADurb.BinA166]|nr:MAG: hypothetical protein BWY99_02435 [Synergistetes bacterium ADurb.BinA166]
MPDRAAERPRQHALVDVAGCQSAVGQQQVHSGLQRPLGELELPHVALPHGDRSCGGLAQDEPPVPPRALDPSRQEGGRAPVHRTVLRQHALAQQQGDDVHQAASAQPARRRASHRAAVERASVRYHGAHRPSHGWHPALDANSLEGGSRGGRTDCRLPPVQERDLAVRAQVHHKASQVLLTAQDRLLRDLVDHGSGVPADERVHKRQRVDGRLVRHRGQPKLPCGARLEAPDRQGERGTPERRGRDAHE